MNKTFSKILLHIVCCISFLLLPVIFSPEFSTSFAFLKSRGFQQNMFNYVLLLLYFYAAYYYLVPKFYFNKKYLIYIVAIALIFFAIILLGEAFFGGPPARRMLQDGSGHMPPNLRPNRWLIKLGRYLIEFSVVTILPLMLHINFRWKQVEQEKTSTELSFLKAQINPHFLFNSLNSIYSLTIEENAQKSSESVIKLSQMMRYVLVESQQQFVSLEKEMTYLTNYLDLQKVRFGDALRMNLNISGKAGTHKIAPLLLIPFVENAFKYGVNPNQPAEILIHVTIQEDSLKMVVKNAKVRMNISDTEKQGIGLTNTRFRLKLLYPQTHNLTIKEEETNFAISLYLFLS